MTTSSFSALRIHPMTIKAAIAFVGEHHRHSKAPVGGLFAVGVKDGDELVGVGIAGRPVARMLNDGRTVEIIRVCTLGALNACSMIYGALCRAAKALGYHRVVSYTLGTENGASLKASGFSIAAQVAAESQHDRKPRSRNSLQGIPLMAEEIEKARIAIGEGRPYTEERHWLATVDFYVREMERMLKGEDHVEKFMGYAKWASEHPEANSTIRLSNEEVCAVAAEITYLRTWR